VERCCFNFLFRIHKRDHTGTAREYEFTLVLKNYLDHLIAVAKQYRLFRSLPLFNVGDIFQVRGSFWLVLFGEVESHGLKFAVAFQV
jgi:hypothetical protein